MTTGVVWKYLVTYCRSDYSSYLVFGDFEILRRRFTSSATTRQDNTPGVALVEV